MRFEWDEAKNEFNIRKHGIDFNDVTGVFDHPMLNMPDNRDSYGEERWIGLGMLNVMVTLVVYTERDGDVIRIISARKATKQEAKRYEQAIKN